MTVIRLWAVEFFNFPKAEHLAVPIPSEGGCVYISQVWENENHKPFMGEDLKIKKSVPRNLASFWTLPKWDNVGRSLNVRVLRGMHQVECGSKYFPLCFVKAYPCKTWIFGGWGRAQIYQNDINHTISDRSYFVHFVFLVGETSKSKPKEVLTLLKVSIQSISLPHHTLILTIRLLCNTLYLLNDGMADCQSRWSMWTGLLLEFKILFSVHLPVPPRSFRPPIIYFKQPFF